MAPETTRIGAAHRAQDLRSDDGTTKVAAVHSAARAERKIPAGFELGRPPRKVGVFGDAYLNLSFC